MGGTCCICGEWRDRDVEQCPDTAGKHAAQARLESLETALRSAEAERDQLRKVLETRVADHEARIAAHEARIAAIEARLINLVTAAVAWDVPARCNATWVPGAITPPDSTMPLMRTRCFRPAGHSGEHVWSDVDGERLRATTTKVEPFSPLMRSAAAPAPLTEPLCPACGRCVTDSPRAGCPNWRNHG